VGVTGISEPTRLAFAGAGWVTVVHGLAAKAFDDVRIVRVASRSPGSAARRAAQTGAEAADYADLPGDADAVVVATPPALHRREAERAVAGGAAALVEAPLAATLADADAIVALAAGGGRVAYGENLAHSPAVAEAVQACRGMGAVTHLEVRCAQGRPDAGSGRLDPAWGGGALFDLGCHAVALALLLAAPARVTSVEARVDVPRDLDVDDDGTATLAFDTGLRAEVRATWRAAAPAWDAQAASATGAVRLELVPEPAVDINGASKRLAPPPGGLPSDQLHHLGYLDQIAALAADARAHRAPRIGPELGRLVLDVLCAAYASTITGEPEPVPFTGPRDRTPHELWRGW
jgi:scyllo-inositol 2-dehydrogenase (NADP+)